MSIRTIMQTGQGFGPGPVSIVASIDGQQVFAGTVPTLDEAPVLPLDDTPQIFSWTVPISFAGTQALSIDVIGGDLVLTFSGGDFRPMSGPSTSGAGAFGILSWQTVDGQQVPDPLTNVIIGEESVQRTVDAEDTGQWHWLIPEGQNFSATVNIDAGLDYPSWLVTNVYPQAGCVIDAGQVYKALQVVQANTAITNTAYWQPQS